MSLSRKAYQARVSGRLILYVAGRDLAVIFGIAQIVVFARLLRSLALISASEVYYCRNVTVIVSADCPPKEKRRTASSRTLPP
jgi:hypothetical protein